MVLIKKPKHEKIVKILIIGAGVGGKLVCEYLLENPHLNYHIIGFVDDDPLKIGKDIHKIPVLGSISNINNILSKTDADEILIAIPSLSGEEVRRIFESINNPKIRIKILPSSFETSAYLEEGKADFGQVRDLRIEDFFRRKPVISNFQGIKEKFSYRTILVTGAAGSIGSELCRQLLRLKTKVIALDNRETALHDLDLELKETYKENIVTVLADIKEKQKIRKIFEKYNPLVVFHAAAYKHVPMTESNPDEAVKTNVFGTQNLVELVDELGISTFILISTDKSADPCCTLGLTKGVAEIITRMKSKRSNSKFLTVRFGNVLNSDGSIIPLFEKQIEESNAITITHPDIKRFFMTIPEAVQLVIQSVLIGKNGELFILDMGEQHNILKIAETLIKLKGLEPHKDIEIKFIGLRKGDKMEEVLLNSYETKEKTENERIFFIKNNVNIDKEKLEKDLTELKKVTEEVDNEKIVLKLKEIFSNSGEKKKFLPYNLPSIGYEEIEEVVNTLKSNWITMGPKTIKLEQDIANYIGVKHAIVVNSCTAALHLSLIALGIGKDDEVILPPYTFASTANVVCHVEAKPVFVDVQENSFNIDPMKIERAITEKTKAIIVVHYGGQAADIDEIKKIADKYHLKIIEDAAHAIGSEYKGRKIGSLGNLTCFSFYATKNMTTGDGGAITTNDNSLADKLRILRLHGISKDAWNRYSKEGSWYYEIEDCGWKYNLTDIQASLGIPQLRKLDSFIKRRQELAKIYDEELSRIGGVVIPVKNADRNHIYHLYPVLLKNYDRNQFIQQMSEKNIGTSVHFIPLHLHPFYQREYGYKKGDFPVSEKLYNQEISLPLYPEMTRQDISDVILATKEILSNKSPMLTLRSVETGDCEFIYKWRNYVVARQASRNTQEISYEEHRKWFFSCLSNPLKKIYVAVNDQERIGQIRFDKQAEAEAEVSVTIAPEKYGKGYGSEIVSLGSKKYLEEEPNVRIIRAEIRQENKSSLRIFEKAGYVFIRDKGEWKEFWLTRTN